MKWSFSRLNLSSLILWGSLFAAGAASLVLTVHDVIRVAREDEARLRLIDLIDEATTNIRALQRLIDEPVIDFRAARFEARAVQTALIANIHVLDGITQPPPLVNDIAVARDATIDAVNRISAVLPRVSRGIPLERIEPGNTWTDPQYSLKEPLQQLDRLQDSLQRVIRSEDSSLQNEIDDVIRSFVIVGVLGVLFQFWLYRCMRKDVNLRAALQQKLTHANTDLNDRVAERTRELDERNRQLAFVTRNVIETQEKERRSVALQLHDDIGQDLGALMLLQRRVLRDGEAATGTAIAKPVGECIELTQAIYNRVGEIALALRPSMLDRLGFGAALNWFVRQARSRTDSDITASANVPDDLPMDVALAAFRIVQEAVANAIRHAQSASIDVIACREPQLFRVCVTDDGIGFNSEALASCADPFAGFGILGMHERAQIAGGRLKVESKPGHGTRVVAEFPLRANKAEPHTAGADAEVAR